MASPLLSSSSPRRLEGKVAIITGGASGIGESTARLFAHHGAKVIIADIQGERGKKVCSEINDNGGAASFVQCNVAEESDVQRAVETAVQSHGKLDIMFNNAGVVMDYQPITQMDKKEAERVMGVNYIGVLLGIKHAGRAMAATGGGSIISTASTTALCAGIVVSSYAASKRAVVGLTKDAAVELGGDGVRVNCISPHLLATPLACEGLGFDAGKLESDVAESTPLKVAPLKAEDIAYAALFLASDESRYVSGLNLVVDGAYTITNPSLKERVFS